jgi:NAD(P)H-hydrate epimerase
MKIFSREQISYIDKQTRILEPISEVDLMERASKALAEWLIAHCPASSKFALIAGSGNNGGDALAVACMLASKNIAVDVYLPELGGKRSEANQINLERLQGRANIPLIKLAVQTGFPDLSKYNLLVDGLYGSGLNRPLDGFVCAVIDWMNQSGVETVSIDLPSGLMCDENIENYGAMVRATQTLTLGSPKLALFFSENAPWFGNWEIVQFGLSEIAIEETKTNYHWMVQSDVIPILKRRNRFAHKGSYGHGLLLSGSKGKFGAAQLAARGALRAGLGLLTVHVPQSAAFAIQIALPEAMSSIDPGDEYTTELPDLGRYSAIAAGPGLGTEIMTQAVIFRLIQEAKVPLVLDADALNILAENPEWIKQLPEETILTPHPVEFDRLSGIVVKTEEERLQMATHFAFSYRVILVLKGAFTRIIFPDGTVWFNSTGNPGMATGGSGDVLTGIILGLLCQGYSAGEAAMLGVFLHGRSADLRVKASSQESLIASEIADYLGDAFASLKWR